MNKLKLILFFFMSIIFSSSNSYYPNIDSKTEISILFIGNSLTYTNNLPKLIKKTGKKKNLIIKTQMIAFPNYSIADHWNDEKVQENIAQNKHDYVIIQQGPSSQIEGREMLIDYGKKYNDLCKKSNTKLCYFMVWPSLNYYHSFDYVIKNYSDAAIINNAILLPVGKIWKEHFDRTKNLNYYSSDGFHPSLEGSQITADIIVDYLSKI